jgi:hypothetical protein
MWRKVAKPQLAYVRHMHYLHALKVYSQVPQIKLLLAVFLEVFRISGFWSKHIEVEVRDFAKTWYSYE